MIGAYIRIRDDNGQPYLRGETLVDIPKGTVVCLRKTEKAGLYQGPEGCYVLTFVAKRGPTFPKTSEQTLLAFVD